MCRKIKQPIIFLLAPVVCALLGCSNKPDTDHVKALNDTNIKKVCSAYQLYAARSGYTGPKSMEELKTFLKTNEKISRNLELMGIDQTKIDEMFISENDGKEFECRWGVFVNPDTERAKTPLVFEREGKNGVRLVILGNRKILEVSNDKKYEALLSGKINRNEAKSEAELQEEAEAAAG